MAAAESSSTPGLLVVVGSYEQFVCGLFVSNSALRKACEDGSVCKFTPKFVHRSHHGTVRCAAASERSWLVTGGSDDLLRIFNANTMVEHGSLYQHTGDVSSIAFFKDSHMLSGAADGNVCVWSTKDWECLKTLPAHKKGVFDVSIHPSGRLFLSIGGDSFLRLWDLHTGKLSHSIRLHALPSVLEWAPAGTRYALASAKTVQTYSVEGEPEAKFDMDSAVNSLVWLDETTVAVACESGEIAVMKCNGTSHKRLCAVKMPTRCRGVGRFCMEKDVFLVAGASDGTVTVWKIPDWVFHGKEEEGECSVVAQAHGGFRVTCLAVQARKNEVGTVKRKRKKRKKKRRKAAEPEAPAAEEKAEPKRKKKKRS